MVGNTDGVYDERGNTIDKITPKNFAEVKKVLGGSKSIDVTGGMLHKVEESLNLAKKLNIKTLIINGNMENSLLKAILGKEVVSTIILKRL